MRLAPPEQAGGQSGGDTSCIVKVEEGAAVKVKEEEEGEGGGDDKDRIREMIMKGTPRVRLPCILKSKSPNRKRALILILLQTHGGRWDRLWRMMRWMRGRLPWARTRLWWARRRRS